MPSLELKFIKKGNVINPLEDIKEELQKKQGENRSEGDESESDDESRKMIHDINIKIECTGLQKFIVSFMNKIL